MRQLLPLQCPPRYKHLGECLFLGFRRCHAPVRRNIQGLVIDRHSIDEVEEFPLHPLTFRPDGCSLTGTIGISASTLFSADRKIPMAICCYHCYSFNSLRVKKRSLHDFRDFCRDKRSLPDNEQEVQIMKIRWNSLVIPGLHEITLYLFLSSSKCCHRKVLKKISGHLTYSFTGTVAV